MSVAVSEQVRHVTAEEACQHLEGVIVGVVMALRSGDAFSEVMLGTGANCPEVVTALKDMPEFEGQPFDELPSWAHTHAAV